MADALGLTQGERQVMELLAKGLKTRQIARRLGIAPATARRHIGSAAGRLGQPTACRPWLHFAALEPEDVTDERFSHPPCARLVCYRRVRASRQCEHMRELERDCAVAASTRSAGLSTAQIRRKP